MTIPVEAVLRKACLNDVEEMYQLVNKYASDGLMLSRPRSLLYECIRDFVIAEKDGQIVGTAALHILWADLAEVRALAIRNDMQKTGIGRHLVEYCLREARDLGLPRVFTLTYQPGFFQKLGFRVINKEAMPQKVWTECINCPKFPNCDEVCLEIHLT